MSDDAEPNDPDAPDEPDDDDQRRRLNERPEDPTANAPLSRRRRLLRDESIYAEQRRHFVLFDIIPTAAAVASIPVLWHIGVTWVGVSLFVVMWLLTLIGIEVGYHRLFSHNAFVPTPAVKAGLIILGSIGGQGPVVSWAATHRHHHHHSDGEEDSHSPHPRGRDRAPTWRDRVGAFAHSHLLWKWSYPYPSPSHYTPHLLRDAVVIRVSRRYQLWVVLGLVAPTVGGGLIAWSWRGALEGFLAGGVLRLVFTQHVTWSINSLAHLFGARPFRTGDLSTNNAWLFIPTLGGSWHNNHHAFPTTASNQLEWWQFDPCYWLILGLKQLGLVSHVKVPTAAAVKAKRAVAARRASSSDQEPV